MDHVALETLNRLCSLVISRYCGFPASIRVTSQRKEGTVNLMKLALIVMAALYLSGCVLTKLITVPMRVVGAAISIIPVAGNTADDAIDGVADTIDDVPL